jgi:D-arabinose 1-dehydrogenase-like Zn-dependent alcohol dehydrogenase
VPCADALSGSGGAAEGESSFRHTDRRDFEGDLGVDGKLMVIGAASLEPIRVPPSAPISARRSLTGWPADTSSDSEDTLDFSLLAKIRPMIETFPLERAAEAYDRLMSGKARLRVVLTMGKG